MDFTNEIHALAKKIVERVAHGKITRDEAQRLLAEIGLNTNRTNAPVFKRTLLRREVIQISAIICAEAVVDIQQGLPDRSVIMEDGEPKGLAPFIGKVFHKPGESRIWVDINDGERTIHLTPAEQRTHKALLRKHLKLLKVPV